MQHDKELKQFFQSRKVEIPDNGFSKEVMKKIPRRQTVLPWVIIFFSLMLGVICFISSDGYLLFLEQILELLISFSRMELPSFSSVMTYLLCIIIPLSIGFAVYETDVL